MARSRLAASAAIALSFCLSGAFSISPVDLKAAYASPQPDFECKVLPHPLLQADGFLLGEFIYFINDDLVGLTGYADLPEQLPRVVSGSGMQFSNGAITFGAKGDSGFLQLNDGTTFPCNAVSQNANVPATPNVPSGGQAGGGQALNEIALALGTIVRSGPDANATRIDRLPDNEPITLLRETGVYLNEFQWFEIEYSEGARGFAWGGTLCVDTEYSGILIDCRRYAGATAQQRLTGGTSESSQQPSASGQIFGQSLFGSKIRVQPDPNARQVASIAQGTAIEIVQETGAFFDGWQWVLIRYGNGNQGYVWGGTICVTQGRAPTGVHERC